MSQLAQNATKALDNITLFIKSVAKNAPAIALTAAVVPDIMDFMGGLTEPFDQVGESMNELGLVASEGFEDMATDIADAVLSLEPAAQDFAAWTGSLYDSVQDHDWEQVSTDIETGLTSAWTGIVDFFADDSRMTDLGEGAAAIVTGIADFLDKTTKAEWDTIFDGITVAMTAFFENVKWDKVFAGIYNAYVVLAEAIAETTWEILFGGQFVGGDSENDDWDPGTPR